eukprot:scaffold1206_cov160-Amphora_coffeaeformis.AAC.5
MVQNKVLRQQNTTLDPMRDLLLKVQIFCGSDAIWSGSLVHRRDDDRLEHYLSLRINGVESFPIDEIGGLWCQVSGLAIMLPNLKKRTMHWGSRHATTVLDDGILEVVLKLSDAFYLVGLLENCTGTMEELQYMIDSNTLMYYLSHLGHVNASTGLPSRSTRGTCLDGSFFRPTKIILAKSAVESTLLKVNDTNVRKYIGEQSACELTELSNLYETSKKCSSSLRFVVEERRLLLLEHSLLKSFMDLLDTVEIRYTGGRAMTTQLRSGKRSTCSNGSPLWRVEIPRSSGTIPFRSIRQMQIGVAGFPIDADCWPHLRGITVDEDCTVMCLPYNPFVEALFIFDHSWDDRIVHNAPDVEDVGTFVGRLRNQLAGYSEPPSGSKLTMRLWFVRFRFGFVNRHLKALGIHFSQDKET